MGSTDVAAMRSAANRHFLFHVFGIASVSAGAGVLSTVVSRPDLVAAVAVPTAGIWALLLAAAIPRALTSIRRASAAALAGGQPMADAHCDSNLLRALRQVEPELGRLTESTALSATLTIVFSPQAMTLWSGRTQFWPCASVPWNDLKTFSIQQAELRERGFTALATSVSRRGVRIPLKMVLSRVGTSGFRKLRASELDEVLAAAAIYSS